MIPKKIHFIFGLKEDEGGKEFSYFHFLNVLSAKRINPEYEVNFYYQYESRSYWFQELKKQEINFIKLDKVKDEVNGVQFNNYAHKADYLRLELLRDKGGIYLDIDVVCIKPFDPLLKLKCVLGYESVNNIVWGLPNFTILSEENNVFINKWIEEYANEYPYVKDDWSFGAVKLPYLIYQNNLDIVNTVSPEFFSFYGWDDASHYHMFENIGPIYPAYSIHLWESRWWDNLKNISQDYLFDNDTTITRIYRRFALGDSRIEFPEFWQ